MFFFDEHSTDIYKAGLQVGFKIAGNLSKLDKMLTTAWSTEVKIIRYKIKNKHAIHGTSTDLARRNDGPFSVAPNQKVAIHFEIESHTPFQLPCCCFEACSIKVFLILSHS